MKTIEPRKPGRLGEGYEGQSLGFTGVVPIAPVYVAVVHVARDGDDPERWSVWAVCPSPSSAVRSCNEAVVVCDGCDAAAVVCVDGVIPAGDGENWYAYGCLLAYAPDAEIAEATPADEPILAPDVLGLRAAVARHLSACWADELRAVAPHPGGTGDRAADRIIRAVADGRRGN